MGAGAEFKTLRELGHEYLDSLKVYSYSPYTIASYHAGIKDVCEFLERESIETSRVTYQVAEKWLRSLSKRQFNAPSMRGYLTSVRGFWRWLMGQEVVRNNPFKELRSIRYQRPIPKPLAEQQITKMIEAETDPMWRAVWELFYATGLRCMAVRNATRAGINWDSKTLTLISKGKECIKPMSPILLAALKHYLDTVPDKGTKWLFQGKGGAKLRKTTVAKYLELAAKRVGIEQHVHPHLLRHSIATHLLDHGTDLRHVQEFLDHKSILTTQIYTHVSQAKLREAIEKSHPRQ